MSLYSSSSNDSYSSGEEGSDTIIGIARRQQVSSLLDADSKQERDIQLLSADPQLRQYAEGMSSRTCVYCKKNVPGPDTEDHYHHPMQVHFREQCSVYQNFMKRTKETEDAFSAIGSLSRDIDAMASRKEEIERDIRRRVSDILETNRRFGVPGSVLCTSFAEWSAKYDGGKKDAYRSQRTNPLCSSRMQPEHWEVRDYSVAPEDDKTMIRSPKNISRLADDKLQELRRRHPMLMVEIDAELREISPHTNNNTSHYNNNEEEERMRLEEEQGARYQ